jgi:hypothetical protein
VKEKYCRFKKNIQAVVEGRKATCYPGLGGPTQCVTLIVHWYHHYSDIAQLKSLMGKKPPERADAVDPANGHSDNRFLCSISFYLENGQVHEIEPYLSKKELDEACMRYLGRHYTPSGKTANTVRAAPTPVARQPQKISPLCRPYRKKSWSGRDRDLPKHDTPAVGPANGHLDPARQRKVDSQIDCRPLRRPEPNPPSNVINLDHLVPRDWQYEPSRGC